MILPRICGCIEFYHGHVICQEQGEALLPSYSHCMSSKLRCMGYGVHRVASLGSLAS